MSKQTQPRRLAENEAQAMLRSVRTSPQKARLVLDQIKGRKAEDALASLNFSNKKAAGFAKTALESAIANAENNHDLNIDDLVVSRAFADKSIVMKRFRARARGGASMIMKPTCHMTVVVAEKPENEGQE